MIVVSIAIILMVSVLVYTVLRVIKPLKQSTVTIVIPDEICQESIMWYRKIIGMEEGVEKFRELDQFKEHVLSLGEEPKDNAKVITLKRFKV